MSVCLALVIHHAMRMRNIVLCGLPRCTIFLHIISIKGWFSKQTLLKTKRVFWFPLQFFFWKISHYKKNGSRHDQKYIYWSSCKLPIVLVRFKRKLNFLDRFSKNTQILNFMKIPLVWSLVVPCGQKDGRTDRTGRKKLRVGFQNFAKAPKNYLDFIITFYINLKSLN